MRQFSSSSSLWQEQKKEKKEEKEDEKEEEKKDEVEVKEEKKDMKSEKIEELEKLVQDLKHNWKLALADAENIKKIAARDVEKAREFGIEKLVKQLMTVTDTLEITLQNRPNFDSEEHKSNAIAQNAFIAIDAINKQFHATFSNYGMVEVKPAVGDPFDPLLHNALFEVDPPANSDAKPGTVGLIVKPGWKRKDTLFRPAAVGVVKTS
jgi:molecular chaperone GrpE